MNIENLKLAINELNSSTSYLTLYNIIFQENVMKKYVLKLMNMYFKVCFFFIFM